jgi:hypothetical protein
MVCRKIALSIFAVSAFLVVSGASRAQPEPKGSDPPTVTIDDKWIGGTVTSRFGPEAGVWVIAETRRPAAHILRPSRRIEYGLCWTGSERG